MRGNILKIMVWTAVAAFSVGCSDIVVKVNKDKKSEESDNQPAVGENSEDLKLSADNVFSYIDDQEKIKKDAIEFVMAELRQKTFKNKFRNALRDVRDAIIRNAKTTHTYENSLFDKINSFDCSDIKEADLHNFSALSSLGTVLQGALVSQLDLRINTELKLELPQTIIDEAVKLFLLELGVSIRNVEDGEISSEEVEGHRVISHGIVFKIESYKNEIDPEHEDYNPAAKYDDHGIMLAYSKVVKSGKTVGFKLDVHVAPGLYENEIGDEDKKYFMQLNLLNGKTDGNRYISSHVINGVMEGSKKDTRYSRMISLMQQEKRNYYIMKDIARYGLTDSDGNDLSEERSASIDFDALKACTVEKISDDWNPEDIKNPIEDTPTPTIFDEDGKKKNDDNAEEDTSPRNPGSDDDNEENYGDDDKEENYGDDDKNDDFTGDDEDDYDYDDGKDGDQKDDDTPSQNPGQNR